MSPRKHTYPRQAHSCDASLSAHVLNGSTLETTQSSSKIKEDTSSLSSTSTISLDIEEDPSSVISRKRKRGADTPSKAVTDVHTTSTRISPRKNVIKAEDEGTSGKVKKAPQVKRQPAKEVATGSGEVEIHPPPDWEEVYDAVREMRKRVLAPVDTMGCESLADVGLSEKDQRFQTLIALMLSSQTKDTTTALAMRILQTSLPAPGLTLTNILAIDPTTLNTLINAVGFHNNKTRYIKATAQILREKFHDDIPETAEGLMSLPGVGPKMAYLCMSAAWGKTEGIGVDVHVHRITNLWGWHKTKGPEETRKLLEMWLPREKWHEINHLLVGFGQTICAPVGRKCGECVLAERGLCPSAVVKVARKVKRVKREVGKVNEETLLVKEEDLLADGEVIRKEAGVAIKTEDASSDDDVV